MLPSCSRHFVPGKRSPVMPRKSGMSSEDADGTWVYILYIIHYRSYPIVIYHFPQNQTVIYVYNNNICIMYIYIYIYGLTHSLILYHLTKLISSRHVGGELWQVHIIQSWQHQDVFCTAASKPWFSQAAIIAAVWILWSDTIWLFNIAMENHNF